MRWSKQLMLTGLAALLLLSSCSSKDVLEPKQKRIALMMKMGENEYWKTLRMGAEAAAKEFNVSLTVSAPEREDDYQGQLALLEDIFRTGTDALVLAPNDYEKLAGAVDRAVSLHVPVVTVDTEVDSAKVKSFVGINNVEAGRKAAQRLVELTGPSAQLAVMSVEMGAKNIEEREQGLLAELARYPQIQIVSKQNCGSDFKVCGELTSRLLARQGSVGGIVALNAVTSVGVAGAIERLGLAGQVKVVTFDSTQEELEWLQEGVIQATVVQNPFSMGYLGVKAAVDLLAGRKVPERTETATKVIDADNMFWADNQKLLFPFVK
ncbi:substrate-binding domain-containing protein [Paenibacillus cremeus]|uniref:Substrate-binding domain-containing protein n=1 Tax=Paenibacillus cremeus TaxID=2163881 RepID=A0A559JPV9_9BACL|nr:substrate-binding domain-containing protein [Paenibacillus cremeus]TVY01912.1 substrate-binding domain-containing protein [Paenibacillus cremeus]